MSQIIKDFHDHPDSVGETYGQHWCSAMSFAAQLILSALACAVHAFVPGLCKSSASRKVSDLYQQMVTHRHRGIGAANPRYCDAPENSRTKT